MIFLYLLPGYLLVNFYIAARILHWLSALLGKPCNKAVCCAVYAVWFLCAFSPVTAFLLPKTGAALFVRRFAAYWMGVLLYTAGIILLADGIRLLARVTPLKGTALFSRAGAVTVGAAVFVSTAGLCFYGCYHARQIKTTYYNVSVNKSGGTLENLKIVLIADTHMGSAIGRDHIGQTVEKINACEPDIVIFAGDIFDNSVEMLDYPDEIAALFKSIRTKYGVWATYGNHDIDEKILMGFTFSHKDSPPNDSRMREFCEKAGIKLLCDESTLIDGSFYLVGRRDRAKPGSADGTRLTPAELTEGLDKSKPVIFIAHEPDELEETAAAGADLDLSGHTHDGQLFPLTVITDIIWENPCGLLEKNGMTSIVTSGVGVFGPFMRLGSDAEICEIDIHFTAG